ncbi:LysR substrate-binding domain-containing protein [Paraburkholderia sp. MM6662-R1]|uniref:LysR substrate-binding domain-containing protein n=1 Tax=Paraburkholderia sp. MM6662-R1 TaxID=2991066 RepID=UPI003D21EE0E
MARVSLRVATGTTIIIPALPRLLLRYPDLGFDISVTDERVDLVSNNNEVAIWAGDIPDTELVARPISPNRRIVCGSPE